VSDRAAASTLDAELVSLDTGCDRPTPHPLTPHALVVGGTGMLRGVSRWLAETGYSVSVIARGSQRLQALVDAAAGLPGSIHPLSLDYRDTARLRREIDAAQRDRGPISLAVCWIHGTAPEAPYAVAEAVGGAAPCRYFHLKGSASADPAAPDPAADARFREYTALRYREVVLGFVLTPAGARWLTGDEISRGVIRAITLDAPRNVVGVVRPWERRP